MTGSDAHLDSDALRVGMNVWHPGCWNIRVTEEVDVGILGHGLYGAADGRGYTRLTVYGDTTDAVEAAIERARAAEDTYAVYEAKHATHADRVTDSPGNASRELLVERSLSNQISSAFLSRGFVYAEPINVRDGVERWVVLTGRNRSVIREAIDEIRETEEAVIEVTSVRAATAVGTAGTLPMGRLSERQREVFQLARREGYYARPRQTTPEELAAELDITTSTFHEHLRKAEAKLLHEPVRPE